MVPSAPAVTPALAVSDPNRRPVRLHPLRNLRTERWTLTHALLATGMGLAAVLASWDAWREIYSIASGDLEYSHIFLVPVVALWMVFSRRLRIRHCKSIGTPLGIVLALAGWGVYTFGYYNGYQTLFHAGAVLLLIGCVMSVLGKHMLFRFFPAVAVLIFLIPVPQRYRLSIAQPLQAWTAEVVQAILDLIGVPVERNGSNLNVNGKTVLIVEACNGLRMVFALVLVSYAFSFGLPLRTFVRLVVMLASPISAIVCNVIRIVPNALLYGYVSTDAGVDFHNYANWLMLPVSFVMLLGVVRLLRWAMVPVMKYSLAA